MDEMEFTEAESNMNDLVSEYQQYQVGFFRTLLRCDSLVGSVHWTLRLAYSLCRRMQLLRKRWTWKKNLKPKTLLQLSGNGGFQLIDLSMSFPCVCV